MGYEIVHRITCDECGESPRPDGYGVPRDQAAAAALARRAGYVRHRDGQWECGVCKSRGEHAKRMADERAALAARGL